MKSPQTDEVASKFRKVKRRKINYKEIKRTVGVSAYEVEPKWLLPFGSVTQSPVVVWVGFAGIWKSNSWLLTHL